MVIILLGLFVLMVLGFLAFPSLLWARCSLRRTPLGFPHRQLGELPKSLFQFQKGWTSSHPGPDTLYRATGIFRHLLVGKPDHGPPQFLQCDRGGKVFVTLYKGVMRCPVHLDHYLTPRQDEICYSAKTREWVLGPIRFSEQAKGAFEYRLSRGGTYVEIEPVTKETHSLV